MVQTPQNSTAKDRKRMKILSVWRSAEQKYRDKKRALHQEGEEGDARRIRDLCAEYASKRKKTGVVGKRKKGSPGRNSSTATVKSRVQLDEWLVERDDGAPLADGTTGIGPSALSVGALNKQSPGVGRAIVWNQKKRFKPDKRWVQQEA
ncbi:hypothetical protein HDU93_005516, partial [Gonapodya sp. JEL0774]